MDKVNKQELRRLIESGRYQVQPWTALALLDEVEGKDRALDLWSQKAQRISDELEQYRKDAERYREIISSVQRLISARAKKGGANG